MPEHALGKYKVGCLLIEKYRSHFGSGLGAKAPEAYDGVCLHRGLSVQAPMVKKKEVKCPAAKSVIALNRVRGKAPPRTRTRTTGTSEVPRRATPTRDRCGFCSAIWEQSI